MIKIVIAAGGTGGHVFPAKCVSEQLVNAGYEVEFIVDQRGKQYIGDNVTFEVTEQEINSKSKVLLILSVLKNVVTSIYKFIKNRPACVIGFGGYPSFAPVASAQILGIRTIIHEQNAVMGRANAILMSKAKGIFTAFENVLGSLRNSSRLSKRIRCVGNPTRFDHLYKNSKRPNNSVFTILVFGGSQGSKIFADIVAPAICKLKNVKVFQQARQNDIDKLKKLYTESGIEAIVSDFFNDIAELYQQSDLVISRSGASTVFEIMGFRIPSILIPYSRSVNGDQDANAKALGNGTVVLNEQTLTVNDIFNTLERFIKNPTLLKNLSEKLPRCRANNYEFLNGVEYVLTH